MKTKQLNGSIFERMIVNGYYNLKNHEKEINDMNVFPVPDGDTGTNMCMTLENGIKNAIPDVKLNKYLKKLSDGMLLGARGNSGVILSQIFKGLYVSMADNGVINASELEEAFISGYKTAYKAVVKPQEGTILTVCREGAVNIRSQIDRRTPFEDLFSVYIVEMKKSLSYTPELLPMLKEAGVVDSGAFGYITIMEGMLKFLYDEKITPLTEEPIIVSNTNDDFNETSQFDDGYCMEFLLQLMKGRKYNPSFRLERYTDDLKLYGESIVTVQDGTRVRVHVHTKVPGKIIILSQDYGEFITFKLENMQIQHNERDKRLEPKLKDFKKMSIVSVVNGEGAKQIYEELGCDEIIDGGEHMNPSAEDFLLALNRCNSDCILILPNHKNNMKAAEQAKDLYKGKSEIRILPTTDILNGYYALAMDMQDSQNVDYRYSSMEDGLHAICTVSFTKASKTYTENDVVCHPNDTICVNDSRLISSATTFMDCFASFVMQEKKLENVENCILFCGANATEEEKDSVTRFMEEKYPSCGLTILDTNQKTYAYVFGYV